VHATGLLDRLDIELRLAAKASTLPTVASQAHRLQLVYGGPLERKFGAWIGGSLVGSMGSHSQMWISRAEYEEHGPALVAKKGLNHVW